MDRGRPSHLQRSGWAGQCYRINMIYIITLCVIVIAYTNGKVLYKDIVNSVSYTHLLRAHRAQELRNDPTGWHAFKLDDEGEPTNELNGPFDGQVADSKKVGNLVLSLAKSVFGFTQNMTKEEKRQTKESAMDMVKSTPAIRNGLAKTAALTTEE